MVKTMFRKFIQLLVLLSITLGIFININNTIVYADGENYVCFELLGGTSSTITMIRRYESGTAVTGSPLSDLDDYHYDVAKLEYSYDKNDWFPFNVGENLSDSNTTKVEINSTNSKVYFRAIKSRGDNFRQYKLYESDLAGGLVFDYYNYRFNITDGEVKLSGDSNYLFSKDGNIKDKNGNDYLPHYAMAGLFSNCTGLVDASDFILGATLNNILTFEKNPDDTGLSIPDKGIHADGQYYGMFRGCTSLKSIPELPATILTTQCYKYMFEGCASLTAADLPTLNWELIPSDSVVQMFANCSNIELHYDSTKYGLYPHHEGDSPPSSSGKFTTPYTIPKSGYKGDSYIDNVANMFTGCKTSGGATIGSGNLASSIVYGQALYFYIAPELKITYDANGADSGNVPEDNDVHEPYSNPIAKGNEGNLVKAGYEFDGWNTQADGNGITYKANDPIATVNDTVLYDEDLTLYAKWEPIEYSLDNYEFYLGDTNDLEIICKGYQNFNHFQSAHIGDDLLISSGESQNDKCKVESGSTKVTVFNSHLNTYAVGVYDIIFHYDNKGEPIKSKLYVKVRSNPPSPPSPSYNPGYSIPNTGIE